MSDNTIYNILNKYKNEISEEITDINMLIDDIKKNLQSISDKLLKQLIEIGTNAEVRNGQLEYELLHDSQGIREFIDSLNHIDVITNETDNIVSDLRHLDIFDIIVLKTTSRCTYLSHKTHDVTAFVPVLDNECNIKTISILASYCEDCKQYTILKSQFDKIDGIILCRVIDETVQSDYEYNEIELEERQSKLYQYGYNVRSKDNLSSRQRHIILASVVEAGILNRSSIASHLNTLIERGSKIPNWKEATDKWKQDKHFVESYNADNLPKIISERIILKYRE